MSFEFELREADPRELYHLPLIRDAGAVREQARQVGVVAVCEDDRLNAHGHFPTYFGILPCRGWYKNPAQSDLFVTHEMEHTRRFRDAYGRKETFQEWARRMVNTEVAASLWSECYVYLDIPDLRERTFAHEIWMDRFLKYPRLLRLPGAREYIHWRRIRVIASPAHDDYVEQQIWNYGKQNVVWCRIWGKPVGYGPFAKRPAYRVVEEHMATLRPGTPGWLDRHRAWLDQVTPDGGVPFPRQAKAFARVYARSVANFGNDVLLS